MEMNMELLVWVLQALLGAFGAVLWSLYGDIKCKHEELEDEFFKFRAESAKELADYKTDSAARFLTREEMEKMVGSIRQTLDRNADKLEARLDRLEERITEVRRTRAEER